ncbi:MAG: hydrogenase expression/formation protein HypE [Clostridia bacterium]|nr:hydrogenase expression/formation protein HypE [Clostridia bacterium]
MKDIIMLDHGSGGKKSAALVSEIFLPAFSNAALDTLGDGAVMAGADRLVMSTDSFVIAPRFFPGGDIGKLSVCGTVNDVCMAGGEPKYLSLGLILEEGLEVDELQSIAASIAMAAGEAGVHIVTGDTKVVERGKGDGVYINTAGVGFLRHAGLSPARMREGDAVIVSGAIGDHGTAVMLCRKDLGIQSSLCSDCAPLTGMCKALAAFGSDVRVLRDPTRGGVATALNEFVEGTGLCIELMEDDIPIREEVRAGCDLLGLDPLYCANEGKLIAVVAAERAEAVLSAIQNAPYGENAAIIGRVSARSAGRVLLHTGIAGTRMLTKLTGAALPRIC